MDSHEATCGKPACPASTTVNCLDADTNDIRCRAPPNIRILSQPDFDGMVSSLRADHTDSPDHKVVRGLRERLSCDRVQNPEPELVAARGEIPDPREQGRRMKAEFRTGR